MLRFLPVALLCACVHSTPSPSSGVSALRQIAGAKPRNIVFIITDDHRYDAMGFMGHAIVRTPNLDRMARSGVHLRNAFVTTSLCSPSRATILTGLYAHQHKVVDNNTPVPAGTTFFPQYLQRGGYQTALVGKSYADWVAKEEQRHRDLMKAAGFLAGQ